MIQHSMFEQTEKALETKERYFFSGRFGREEWHIKAYDAMLTPAFLMVEEGDEGSEEANKKACIAAMDRLCEQYGREHEGPISYM